jgi:hypothetical protein
MDVIDDVDLAIEAYLDTDFPADDGEKYLRIMACCRLCSCNRMRSAT